MTPKSILVLVDGGPLSESTLETGLAVAGLFGAQVQALHVQADPATLVPIVGEGMSGAMVEQVMDAMSKAVDQRSERAKAAYEKIAGGGLKIAWRLESGPEPVVLAAAGRLSDLIVLGRPDKSMDGQTAASLDAALFDTGRAVLVAPPATVAPSLCRRVALAWNGSAEASRVVGMALPYLAKAEAVTILSAPGTDKRAPAEALAGYLALHGIKADVESFELHHHQSVGHALLEHAQKANADLLAMGAYGHSRLREMILGGATRDVLAQATIPVLMAH